MSTQTRKMDETPGLAEAAQNVVDKGLSYIQTATFGSDTAASTASTTATKAKESQPADPRVQSMPKVNLEEALRHQNRSEPPTELLEEAGVAKKEKEEGRDPADVMAG